MSNEPLSSHELPQPATHTRAERADELLDERDGWAEEQDEQLPRRPRRRWLAPLPVSLALVLAVAGGFIAGVLVEKGERSSAGATLGTGTGTGAAGGRGGLGGFAGLGGAGGARAGAGGAGAAGAGATVGQVAFVHGSTLYVTNAEGQTVKVTTSRASAVTKSVKSTVAAIHPGETVLVTGSAGADGAIDAETIRTGEALGGGGLSSLFGGAGGRAGASPGAASGRGSGSEQTLFGNGG